MKTVKTVNTDLALVGGGLANGLIALELARSRPELRFVLLERGTVLGGEHTWSFHETDLDARARDLVAPLVVRSFEGHDVRFPGHRRALQGAYHAVLSERLHEVALERCRDRVRLEADVVEVDPSAVGLADGTRIEAQGVLDGRGFVDSPHIELGYQKFLGRVLELETPHAIEHPVLMDATVEQRDGFRFFYVLPFSERSVLVEDTRYSDGPELAREAMRDEIDRYAASLGLDVARVASEEEGVLPVVLSGDIEAFWAESGDVPRTGLRAGLFHPTTGYSLPEAARLAVALAEAELDSKSLLRLIRRRSLELWRRGGFFRLLNRMLFRAAAPEERYRVLERFYRLPEPLIARFYANRATLADKIRILTGRPPVPIGRAVRCLSPSRRPGAAMVESRS